MVRSQVSLGIHIRRKVRENNVAILPKRVVLLERFLARAPVSLIDFSCSEFEDTHISLECSGVLQLMVLDLCLYLLHQSIHNKQTNKQNPMH